MLIHTNTWTYIHILCAYTYKYIYIYTHIQVNGGKLRCKEMGDVWHPPLSSTCGHMGKHTYIYKCTYTTHTHAKVTRQLCSYVFLQGQMILIPDLHPPSRPESFQACAITRQKQFSLQRIVLLCSVPPTGRKLTPNRDDWKTGTKWGNDLDKAMLLFWGGVSSPELTVRAGEMTHWAKR